MRDGALGRLAEPGRKQMDLVTRGEEFLGEAIDVRFGAAPRGIQILDLKADLHRLCPHRQERRLVRPSGQQRKTRQTAAHEP